MTEARLKRLLTVRFHLYDIWKRQYHGAREQLTGSKGLDGERVDPKEIFFSFLGGGTEMTVVTNSIHLSKLIELYDKK